MTVAVVISGSQVWTRQTHVGKSGAICAATNRNYLWLNIQLFINGQDTIHKVHMRFDFFFHIEIRIFNLQIYGAFPIFLIHIGSCLCHNFFFLLEQVFIVIADNIFHSGMLHRTFHSIQMNEAFSVLCMLWFLSWRHKTFKFHSKAQCISHFILGRTGMDA